MEGWKVELFSARELRAMVLLPVAVVALAVSALVWIHPGGSAKHVSAAATPRPTPIAPSVQISYFASPKLGWVVLSGGSFDPRPLGLYRTSDGGRTWKELPVDLGTGFVSRLTFFDSKHGYLFTGIRQGLPSVLATSDGGDHWDVLPTPPVPDGTGFLFISPTVGWAVSPGSLLQRTTDGGRNWMRLAAAGLPRTGATQFQFLDADHGWVATPAIYTTADGGETWRPVPAVLTPPSPPPGPTLSRSLMSVAAAPPAYVLIFSSGVRTSSQTAAFDYSLYSTPDAGATWRQVAIPSVSLLQALDMLDGNRWWLVHDEGELWRSEDAGRHWTGIRAAVPAGLTLASVHFFDAGSAVGTASLQSTPTQRSLVATSDGGAHWRVVSLPHG